MEISPKKHEKACIQLCEPSTTKIAQTPSTSTASTTLLPLNIQHNFDSSKQQISHNLNMEMKLYNK